MKILSANEVETILLDAGVSCMGHIWDKAYACPTVRYIQEFYSKGIESIRFQLGLTKWSSEVNDCDNFSVYAMAHFQVCHARTPGHPNAGIAFGVFCYQPAASLEGHAINFAICNELLCFFEPQTYKLKMLTKKEIESCTDYLLC